MTANCQNRPGRLSARLSRHLQHGRHRRGRPGRRAARRPRPSLHARLPVPEGGPLPRPRLPSRPAALADEADRPQGDRAVQPHRLGRGHRHDRRRRFRRSPLRRTARRRSCPTATPAPWASSRAPASTAASSTGWARRCWTGPSAPRPARPAATSPWARAPSSIPETVVHSRYIINWGSNTSVTNMHLWALMHQARKHGARIVTIDPYRCKTAARSDWWLPIRPGTDAALALGMMHVLWRDGLQDDDYLHRYCLGADAAARARPAANIRRSKVAPITGIAVGGHRAAGPRVRHDPAGADPPELRPAAARRRRHGGADHHLPAGGHRGLAARRRRRPAQHQQAVPVQRRPRWSGPT